MVAHKVLELNHLDIQVSMRLNVETCGSFVTNSNAPFLELAAPADSVLVK